MKMYRIDFYKSTTTSKSIQIHIRICSIQCHENVYELAEQVAEAGGAARLRCAASSMGASLQWLHDGVALASRGPDLELRGLTRSQRGTYQCVARDGIRSAQAAAEIRLGGQTYYKNIMDIFKRRVIRLLLNNYLQVVLQPNACSVFDKKRRDLTTQRYYNLTNLITFFT